MKRPFIEKVPFFEGASIAIRDRRLNEAIPFEWHHHPEFELTLTLNSRGQRFIGDDVSAYDHEDLVLVGSNLPHTWSSSARYDAGEPHVARIVWFRPDWPETLVATFPELTEIGALFARAAPGLAFSPQAVRKVRSGIDALYVQEPRERIGTLLGVLADLAHDTAATPLSARDVASQADAGDRARIDRVLDYIHARYAEPIAIPELADVAALSPSGLGRLFTRHTRMPVSAYIMRLRIARACALLSSTQRPIGHIATDVGYASLANFNRQFRAIRGTTPRAYRRRFSGN